MTLSDRIRAILRLIAERLAPDLTRTYRRLRDVRRDLASTLEPTGSGFDLIRGGEFRNRSGSRELLSLQNDLSEADVFVDVGANVGFFTVLAARLGVPVVALEPHPDTLGLLLRNIESQVPDQQVRVLPVALSTEGTSRRLLGGGQGASLQTGWGGIAENYHTRVAVWPADALLYPLLAPIEGRKIIKIDVEGHEMAVIRHAERLLALDPAPVWYVEHGPDTSSDYAGLFQAFWSAGYTAYALPEDGSSSYRVVASHVNRWIRNGYSEDLMFRFAVQ